MPTTTSCPFCGAERKARTLTLFGRPAFAGFEPCQCEGARREREEAERAEAELQASVERRRRREAYERAGIMPRFIDAEHPQAQECADAVMGGMNLYVFGGVGTLKTHLASATSRIVIDHGGRVKFSAMWKILDAIKDGFKEGYDPLPTYQSVEYLVLDDFGKESPTDFALERIFALVDERSACLHPTVITTQYKPGLLIDRLAKNGDRDTATAIVSRLRQDCKMVELQGGDRRRG